MLDSSIGYAPVVDIHDWFSKLGKSFGSVLVWALKMKYLLFAGVILLLPLSVLSYDLK